MAELAKGRSCFVFRQDKVGNGGVVRFVAGEAGMGGAFLPRATLGPETGCPSTG